MRPRIICHMASTIDGRIDGAAFKQIIGKDQYEATGEQLKGDAWICGRTTMQMHFAAGEFAASSKVPVGKSDHYVARRAESYAISVDTHGKLNWSSNDVYGDHLICITSEGAPGEYIDMLRAKQISFVVTGADEVDLPDAVEKLAEHFGIRTLLLEGGGHINGAFVEAGLVDEVSLLVTPGIDGRKGTPTVFDGIIRELPDAVKLKLNSVKTLENDVLWLRYEVLK